MISCIAFKNNTLWRLFVFKNKKVVIWDLDNTLYRITPDFADTLDETMAVALIEDLGVPLSFDECKALVKESYKIYRDGGEYFYHNYNISPKDLSFCYHKRNPVHLIEPYADLASKLKKIPLEQYVFTASNRHASERILRHIGLYDMFKDRFYSVEDFGVYKKTKTPMSITLTATKLAISLRNAFLLMIAIPTLNLPNKQE